MTAKIIRVRLVLIALLVTVAAACSSTREAPGESDRPPLGRISPLGLGQPDPDILVAEALGAWRRGDLWAFLSHFAFADPEDGSYRVPDPRAGGAFTGVTAEELEPIKNSLFPLARLEFARPVYGEPRNLRNNPPTVGVPVTIERDLDALSPERQRAILAEVNVSLRRQGRAIVTWDEYRRQVEAQPTETFARFVYIDRAWRFDGGTWAPGRR